MDTHGEVHVAAIVSPLGKALGTESFPATADGYRRLLVWARKAGTVRRAGVEGTGTFGAGLSRYLLAQQIQVFEVNRPDRSARRLLGKSDPLDAQAAARAVFSGRARARAKSGDGPGLRGQGPHPGDQPAQSRPGHRRSRTAGTTVQLWVTASCSAPAHASGQATARKARTRWSRPPI
ncbi:transposase [Streptomyces sp. NPDC100445]|uniref:IS110 family transposase n=1 Tax=Streptomyces sp. NPDC100445 TaxID=3366102 RepID=UPI003808876A